MARLVRKLPDTETASRRVDGVARQMRTDKAADGIVGEGAQKRRRIALAGKRHGDIARGAADLGGELLGHLRLGAVGQGIKVHPGAAHNDGGEGAREVEREATSHTPLRWRPRPRFASAVAARISGRLLISGVPTSHQAWPSSVQA